MININRQPLPPNAFQSQLIEFIKNSVPKIVSLNNPLTIGSYKRNEVASKILKQISWWFFEGEQNEELSKLEKFNNPSNLCGHVFKPGEATYSCRECGADPTCVLCQRCFRKSEHVNHKYKFHSSNGGGCCDCGDKEAWKRFYSCSIHNVDENDIVEDVCARFPVGFCLRAESMFSVLLEYIVSFLTIERVTCNELPEPYTTCNPKDTYATVVYNDETHTFDYVIDILQRAAQCSDKVASDFATVIDREGRTVIKVGSIRECNTVKDVITSSRNSNILGIGSRRRTSLITRVIHTNVFSHQEFSLTLLDWLNKIASQSDGLRQLVSNVLLKKMTERSTHTSATQFMLADKKMWKLARASYQQLFMSTLLMRSDSKKAFAVEYSRCYQHIFEGFLADDHDHSDSISSMSVQLFTVPTLAHFLVAEEGVLSIVFDVVIKGCCSTVTETNKVSYKLDKRKLKQNLNRLEYCFYDLKYFLTNIPSEWNNKVKKGFLPFFDIFVEFLAAMEGMDEVVRKVGQHIEHEPEWELGVTLLMRFINITGLVLRWCASTDEMLQHCITTAVTKLKSLHQKEYAIKSEATYFGVTSKYVSYDITKNPVSVHYPLTRFVAGLATQCGSLNIPLTNTALVSCIFEVVDCSFRALALCAQVGVGAWRRNGMGLANQVYYMHHHYCRAESFDRDLQMLQAYAAIVDPNIFCLVLQMKLNLQNTENFEEYHTTLTEEFLAILVFVCAERFCDGIGKVSYDEKVRREIIHVLATGAKPHSKIQKLVSSKVTRNPRWEVVLRQVADLKMSTNSRQGAKYELKQEYLCEVSPCFYHYTTATDQSNAQTETLKRRKENNLSTVSIPQPSPTFTDPFKNVVNILQCSFLLDFIKKLLTDYTPESVAPYRWSDRLFEKILYLVGFGIIEERERVKIDSKSEFCFCEKADSMGVLEVLRSYSNNNSVTLHKESICWILNAVNDVNKRRSGIIEEMPVVFEEPSVSSGNESIKQKKELAKQMRENLIEHMKLLQKKFIDKMETEEQPSVLPPSTPPVPPVTESLSVASVCTELSWQLSSVDNEKEVNICILCQDNNRPEVCIVTSAFAQLSSALSKRQTLSEYSVLQFGDINNSAGIHVSTCSHMMHFDCWSQYFDSVKERDERRPIRMRRFLSTFSTAKNEFLCPLCSRLSNCVIPAMPHSSVAEMRELASTSSEEVSLGDWLRHLEDSIDSHQPVQQTLPVHVASVTDTSDEVFYYSDELPAHTTMTLDATTEVMEVDEDSLQSAFQSMIKSIEKNCDTGGLSNELTIWSATAFTFQVTEVVSRFLDSPIMAPPSIRTKQALSSITRNSFLFTKCNKENIAQYESLLKLLLGKSSDNLLETNIFCSFVKSIFSCERLRLKLKMSSIINDRNILFICSLAQVIQIFLFVNVKEVTRSDNSSHSTLAQVFNRVRSYAGLTEVTNIDDRKLEQIVLKCFNPFLRCCALFLRHVTNVSPPASLEGSDSSDELCAYLGLPSRVESYFDSAQTPGLDDLMRRWCSHPGLAPHIRGDCLTFPALAEIGLLIGLDDDYSDVIAKTADFKCPRFRAEDDSVTPATCLICSRMVCSQSYCCQQELDGANVGACSYHAHICNFGSGIFLKGRDCTLILLNQKRGCYRPAPYLDEFGETDLGLRRGNPLRLDKNRVKELNLLWLEHKIPETIVRETETNHSLINIDWAHL